MKVYIDSKDPTQIEKTTRELLKRVKIDEGQQITIICIGTDRVTGDSLGPLVGTMLDKDSRITNNEMVRVVGKLGDNVTALNLAQRITKIPEDNYVIAIDACLGKLKSVGNIIVNNGPIYPGGGVGKNLPPIGDTTIQGVVNIAGLMNYTVLGSTSLHLVINLAEIISGAVAKLITEIDYNREISYTDRNRDLYI